MIVGCRKLAMRHDASGRSYPEPTSTKTPSNNNQMRVERNQLIKRPRTSSLALRHASSSRPIQPSHDERSRSQVTLYAGVTSTTHICITPLWRKLMLSAGPHNEIYTQFKNKCLVAIYFTDFTARDEDIQIKVSQNWIPKYVCSNIDSPNRIIPKSGFVSK